MEKRTKIVATISDQRCEVDFIRGLWEAGMNAVRINSAHVTPESATRIVRNTRAVSESIAVIIDTKGPEIRLTAIAKPFEVTAGQTIDVQGTDQDLDSSPAMLYMNDPLLANHVPEGASLLIDDGEIELLVTGKKNGTLRCRVQNAGMLRGRKSVNIPGVAIDLPSVTDRDREFILWAIKNDVDFIAHSFVRKPEDVLEVRKIIKAHHSPIKIIAKIENREGVDNIDEILKVTYGIMVARGDLGVEIPAEKIPVTQRMIVGKCIESKTPVIIATQMLHSMISSPRPTRAEVSDIASAIYQRVDAIMLSGETASGDYPLEAVQTMTRVAGEIERDNAANTPFIDMNLVRINSEITAQLSRSAVRATINLPVKAILIDTLTGRTGRYIAAFRGQKPVYAVCWSRTVMRLLAISYGIYASYEAPTEERNPAFMPRLLAGLRSKKRLAKNDLVVVVGGSFGMAQASYMEIGKVSELEEKNS